LETNLAYRWNESQGLFVYPIGFHEEKRSKSRARSSSMTFDELWRRNLPSKDPVVSLSDSQAEGSSFRDPVSGESAFEDLDEPEMNRFLEWLEGTLLIDDLGERRA
jgi:hypothetical protein